MLAQTYQYSWLCAQGSNWGNLEDPKGWEECQGSNPFGFDACKANALLTVILFLSFPRVFTEFCGRT